MIDRTGSLRWRAVLPGALSLCLLAAGAASGQTIELVADVGNPRVRFAVEHLETALGERSIEVRRVGAAAGAAAASGRRIVLSAEGPGMTGVRDVAAPGGELAPEGFALGRAGETVWVLGKDDAGVMYGGLELAEQIALYGIDSVRPMVRNPYMAVRGTKFNIPLDARTPSYTDMSDVAQHNLPEMWSLDFWYAYLDRLAEHRYNLVSLWNLHPFPSMVRVPEYPEVALDDVKRSRGPFREDYSTRVVDIAGPEILADLETVRTLSIDEKIAFWREVMRHADERNISFYLMTWNVYTYGTDGKYGITDDYRNETTIDYMRRSVAAMFDTYPLLAGIGLTTGENFGVNAGTASFREKEEWAFRTFGQGVLDAAGRHPGRKITFIHRLHETGVQSDAATYAATANVAAVDIADWFAPLVEDPDIEFLFSFKYAQAHVYSSTRQRFHEAYVRDIAGMKTLWTLRNDDVYYFRWGAPAFVREFFRNMPGSEVSRGYYYGSDQWVWGREFLARAPGGPRELELDKHWMQWLLWGRLGYDPAIDDDRFISLVERRFPGADGAALLGAWQAASMIYPITTGFHWGLYDFHWYIEGSRGRSGVAGSPTGYHDVDRFIALAPHSGTGYASIPQYVAHVREGRPLEGTSPLEVAALLETHAEAALAGVAGLPGAGGDRELQATATDIEAMAWLGLYYAHKIRGATELALARAGAGEAQRTAAAASLRESARAWRVYAGIALGQYANPLWTNRVGNVDWRRTFPEVLADVAKAGGVPGMASVAPVAGGVRLEAEEARVEGGGVVGSVGDGFTGRGFVTGGVVEWQVPTTEAGRYRLELRYALAEGTAPVELRVGDGTVPGLPLVLWSTGGAGTWAFDRVTAQLPAGGTTLRLSVPPGVRVDALRVKRLP